MSWVQVLGTAGALNALGSLRWGVEAVERRKEMVKLRVVDISSAFDAMCVIKLRVVNAWLNNGWLMVS